MLLCTGRCQLGGRCHVCVPRCEPNLAGCGQPPLCSILPRAGAPRFCGREQDPSWRSSCWRPAQPRASRDPHQHHPGGPRLCCSTSTHHPALGVPPPAPAPGGPSPPPALTLCPAPFPQGFPPSQPGGRESRSTDSPLSPRPAQSKVGTGLGARRSRAHLSPGARRSRGLLLRPTGMLPTPRPGAPWHGRPHRLLLSEHSIFQPPAWHLLSFSH